MSDSGDLNSESSSIHVSDNTIQADAPAPSLQASIKEMIESIRSEFSQKFSFLEGRLVQQAQGSNPPLEPPPYPNRDQSYRGCKQPWSYPLVVGLATGKGWARERRPIPKLPGLIGPKKFTVQRRKLRRIRMRTNPLM